jgi:polyisoprenoid-binding protein YceI
MTDTGAKTEARVRYAAETRISQFTIQAFAAGIIAVVAHSPKIAIREWSADMQFAPDTLTNASVSVKGATSSFDVLDQLRDADRRQLQNVMMQEVLEVSKYPDFAFQSQNVNAEKQKQDLYRVNIMGELMLHGVTRNHSFGCQVALGADSFRAYGEFSILQTDYGIKIASIAGGTLKLQDELKCTFYIVARRSDS